MLTKEFVLKENNLDISDAKQISIKEAKKLINKYKYIQVLTYWYDSQQEPEVNNWIDVEGIGYGWMWCSNWFRQHITFLQKLAVRAYAKSIVDDSEDEKRFIVINDNNIDIFVINNLSYDLITVSNETLCFY